MAVTIKALKSVLNYNLSLKTELESGEFWYKYKERYGVHPNFSQNLIFYMLQWHGMELSEQEEIKEEWKQYFNKCKQTKSYELYMKMRDCLKTGGRKLRHSLLAEVSLNKENPSIEPPKFFNPDSFAYEPICQKYWDIVNKIKSLKESLKIAGSIDEITDDIFS